MSFLSTVRHALSRDELAGALRTSRGSAVRPYAKRPPVIDVVSAVPPMVANTYRALNADPQDWFTVMRAADRGHTGPMIEMFGDARDRDIHLDGVARKRAQSMMGRPIVFTPPDGAEEDRDARIIAAIVRRLLLVESRGFRSHLQHLMQGPLDGYAVSVKKWRTNRDGQWLPDLREFHSSQVCFRETDFEMGWYGGSLFAGHSVGGVFSDSPDSFVIHAPICGRTDFVWRRGVMRAAIIPSFIKRNGLKFWMTLAERFGMPQPYARIPDGEDDDGGTSESLVAKTKEALENLGRIWSMVVSDSVEIDTIDGAGNVNADVHKELIAWANTAQSIGLLGQNLTTEVTGGSFAAAESHRFVAGDLHLADATELSETITQQIVEPVVRFNWGAGAPVPQATITVAQRQTVQPDHVREGIFSADECRRSMGYDPMMDPRGADIRFPVQVQVPDQIKAEPAPPAP